MIDHHPSQVQQALYRSIGLDHTGALMTRDGNKVYVLIIICLYSRNITLKVVGSLEASEVELASVQTEASLEGIEKIHSDNYKSFKKLEKKHPNWHFTSALRSLSRRKLEKSHKKYEKNTGTVSRKETITGRMANTMRR